MQIITDSLESLALGRPTTFLNLTLFPLIGKCEYVRNYLTLRDAVRAGTASVREVSEGGSVPELVLENTGKEPVLILEGEELIGAKQNRTANVTILAPPDKTLRIPVSCVEAGRWRYQGREFAPSEQVHFAAGRLHKMAAVSRSMARTGSRQADQAEVWDDIADKSVRMHVRTPTGAMSDVYGAHQTRLDDYVGAFRAEAEQMGVVFAIGESIEGLELFDCPETLAEMLPKLIRSYAIDAIESVGAHRSHPSAERAQAFIERLSGADFETYPALGEGTEVRVSGTGIIAGGLVAEGRVVHLAAFAAPTEAGRPDRESHGFARMRTRRRGMGGRDRY